MWWKKFWKWKNLVVHAQIGKIKYQVILKLRNFKHCLNIHFLFKWTAFLWRTISWTSFKSLWILMFLDKKWLISFWKQKPFGLQFGWKMPSIYDLKAYKISWCSKKMLNFWFLQLALFLKYKSEKFLHYSVYKKI